MISGDQNLHDAGGQPTLGQMPGRDRGPDRQVGARGANRERGLDALGEDDEAAGGKQPNRAAADRTEGHLRIAQRGLGRRGWVEPDAVQSGGVARMIPDDGHQRRISCAGLEMRQVRME